jgi:hypothetical protein
MGADLTGLLPADASVAEEITVLIPDTVVANAFNSIGSPTPWLTAGQLLRRRRRVKETGRRAARGGRSPSAGCRTPCHGANPEHMACWT